MSSMRIINPVVGTDEAEYQRLMALDWRNELYKDNGVLLMCSVARDRGPNYDVVFRWYSAQPTPDFGVLPEGVSVRRATMYLSPHYTCFLWMGGMNGPDIPLPLNQTGVTIDDVIMLWNAQDGMRL